MINVPNFYENYNILLKITIWGKKFGPKGAKGPKMTKIHNSLPKREKYKKIFFSSLTTYRSILKPIRALRAKKSPWEVTLPSLKN